MNHVCHAKGCDVPVPPKMLMCLRHWRMVPHAVQKRIWKTYIPGQEVRKDPTLPYLDAMSAAVKAVATREGK